MSRKALAYSISALAIAAAEPQVSAICPHPTPKVCSAFFTHEVVFVGTVLDGRTSDDFEWLSYRVRVSTVLRGGLKVGETARVYSSNDSARVVWNVGQTYMVFASLRDGRLEAHDDCGPLSDPSRVAATVQQIAEVRQSRETVVEGRVITAGDERVGVAGVTIELRGSAASYRIVSDARGEFRLVVPPGHYRAIVDVQRVQQSDYNWEVDLEHLELSIGQCAQLEFVAKENRTTVGPR